MQPLLARSHKDIGNALRRARKSQGMSQQELAKRSGIWQETISKIENGSPGTKLETLFDLCAALGLEVLLASRSKGNTEHLEVSDQDG